MKLQFPFSQETRWLFFDVRYLCWICGENGQQKGGTELHHIKGRVSDSPYNGAVLCKECHGHANHNDSEEGDLLLKTISYLDSRGYVANEADRMFLKENERIIQLAKNRYD